jgi:hypothetical protein
MTPPSKRDLVPRSADSGSLLREMFVGADESAPPRPGRYLETPQVLGILPTLHFWNRRDVWKSGRWLFAPLAGASALMTGLASTAVDPWLVPLVGLASGLPVVLAHGLLERYVRRRVRERARAAAASPSPP